MDENLLYEAANQVDNYLCKELVSAIINDLSYEKLTRKFGEIYCSRPTFYRKRRKVLELYELKNAAKYKK